MVGRGAMSNSIAELERSPLIMVVGSNTTETHPVVADPRNIELTRLAHRHLRLDVGTDIALFNAMAHVIIRERLYDEGYVSGRVDGLDELARHVEKYTPEAAEEITGVPAAGVAAAARGG